jgi:septal ring factor EnvC (AmiA/AmiB activator)
MNLFQNIQLMQAVLDVLLILIIIYLLFFKEKFAGRQLKTMRESLQELIAESDRTTQTFKTSLSVDLERLEKLIKAREEQEKLLHRRIEESEKLLHRLRMEKKELERHGSVNKYRRVSELAALGMSAQDIETETGLSSNEIQLIMDIRK